MALRVGIVGLPNVGKSTLFNAITNSKVEAANYPFATIEPNVGVVEVKDERLDFLQQVFSSKKKIYNTIIFTDIAGLVKGASKGEGLGNKFLSNIRECDAIVHVVRLFENKDIVHVENNIDPLRDIEIVNMELILSDIEQLNKWLSKSEKRIESNGNEKEKKELSIIQTAKTFLENSNKLEEREWNEDELKVLSPFSLLTLKPTIYLANVSEDEVSKPEINKFHQKFMDFINSKKAISAFISTQIEFEISLLDEESKVVFISELGLKESGLVHLAKKCFSTLNLSTYFTCGPQEIHAWTFKNGMKGPEAAGIIHSDFEKNYIKAEVYSYKDLFEHKTEAAVKAKGLLKIEGRDYLVKDGDVCHFLVNK